MSQAPVPRNPRQFPTTHWSQVTAAQQPEEIAALNELLVRYWQPVYYFVRARGYGQAAAEDLTQEFFLRLVDRSWLKKATAARGRFRNFLLTLLIHFLSDQGAARIDRQTLFERGVVPVSTLVRDGSVSFDPATHTSPEDLFNARWAAALIAQAWTEFREACAADGRLVWHDLLKEVADGSDHSQHALAERLGISRDQVRYGLEQGKRRFEQHLRNLLREEGCRGEELDAELGELLAALRC